MSENLLQLYQKDLRQISKSFKKIEGKLQEIEKLKQAVYLQNELTAEDKEQFLMDANSTEVNLIESHIEKMVRKPTTRAEELTNLREIINQLYIEPLMQEYLNDKVTEAIPRLQYQELHSTTPEINSDDVTVGENQRHLKFKFKDLSKKKKIAIATAVTGAIILGGSVAVYASVSRPNYSNLGGEYVSAVHGELNLDLPKGKNDNDSTLKPTLAFDPENTDVMIENFKTFIRQALPNGLELTDEELENQVESLINYYVWLNANEMGPTYLSDLYQTDSISHIEIFSDSIYWANVLRFDSMTSSINDNTVMDMSSMIANKKDAELVNEFLKINARLHDAVVAVDKTSINSIVEEYRTLIETKLLDHKSYSYGQGAMDLSFRLVYTGEQLLSNYDIKIMTPNLSKIINEDEFLQCIQSISVSTLEDKSYTNAELTETVVSANTSKKSDNVINIVDLLEDYIKRLDMDRDFTGKKSVADVMVEVTAYIRDNHLLDTYVENPPIDEMFTMIHAKLHPSKGTLRDGDVVIDGGNLYIPREEIKNYGISTEGKSGAQIQHEYEQAVKDKTNKDLSMNDTFTDTEGNVKETGSDAEQYSADYSRGYTAGSAQGTIDGNNLAVSNTTTTGTKGYQDGYAAGYSSSYKDAKEKRLQADKQSSSKVEPSKEQSTEIIEESIINPQPVTNGGQVGNISESTNPSKEEVIPEEVIIEEGILEPVNSVGTPQTSSNSTQETMTKEIDNQFRDGIMTYEDLYALYYNALYGNDSPEIVEETVLIK